VADQDVERQRIRHLRVDRHVTRSGARPPGIGTFAIPRHDPHAVRTVPTTASATLRHASRPIEMLRSRFTVPVFQLGSRRPVPTRGLLSRAEAREPHPAPAPAADRAAHTTAAATGCSRCRRPAGRRFVMLSHRDPDAVVSRTASIPTRRCWRPACRGLGRRVSERLEAASPQHAVPWNVTLARHWALSWPGQRRAVGRRRSDL
jgi:hypothetical protein